MEEPRREPRREHEETEQERARREEGLERARHEEVVEGAGRKGGAASMAAGIPVERAGATAVPVTRDLVRWAPVWAGLLVAIPIQLILGAIGLAVVLGQYDPALADYGQRVAGTMAIWSAVSALIALFVGGYIAGRMAAVSGLRNGLVQGTLVWALTLILGVVLSAMGAVGLLGSAFNIPAMLQQGVVLTGPEAEATIQAVRSSAWWFVVGAILAWAAAAGGGVLGASQRYEEVREEL